MADQKAVMWNDFVEDWESEIQSEEIRDTLQKKSWTPLVYRFVIHFFLLTKSCRVGNNFYCFTHYRSCFFKHLTINWGDYVLVNNSDSDDLEEAEVAKILCVYQDQDLQAIDCNCRAIVQWYGRPSDMPKAIQKITDYNFQPQEVIEDDNYENDIDIETILEKCHVEFVKSHITSVPTPKKKKKILNFFCRYKREKGDKKVLIPIIPDPLVIKKPVATPSKRGRKSLTAPSPNKSLRSVSSEKTPSKRKSEHWMVEKSRKQLSPIEDEETEMENATKNFKKLQVATPKNKSKYNSIDDEEGVDYTDDDEDEWVPKTPRRSTAKKRPPLTETPSNRRRSILKTPNQKDTTTPRKRVSMNKTRLSEVLEFVDVEDENVSPPKQRKVDHSTPKGHRKSQQTKTPEKRTPRARASLLKDFTISQRATPVKSDGQQMQLAREQLHVSMVPKQLPCREKEYQDIYNFLHNKLIDDCGGCMYVSGVPGTGKTATTTEVIRRLQQAADLDEVPEFDFIEINGMRFTEPHQAYVSIYKQLSGKTIHWEQAYNQLDKRFNTPSPKRKITILLVDELDILCNRRQDVVYNLLNWPTIASAKLVVVTIANTMDLPERLLMGKVTSRLGLTRLTFQPYTFQQLQEIIMARIVGTETFHKDAVQLAARKVAAVSGDARRVLDICRRATEIAEAKKNRTGEIHVVSIANVQEALAEMIASPKMQAIKSCTKYEKLFLQSICAEVARTGVDECVFKKIYMQLESICAFSGIPVPSPEQSIGICIRLGSSRLLICEAGKTDIFMKVVLNVSTDDVHFALQEETH